MRALVVLFVLTLTAGSTAATAANAPGGSNYNWYQTDANCYREAYGVLKNYNTHVSLIRSQLATIKASSQDRLSISILFAHGITTGTVLDSTGGNIAPQYRTNLQNLLIDAKNAGFREVLIRFLAIGTISPVNWTSWNAALFQEYWNLVQNLHPLIAGGGITYKIDLGVEQSPPDAGSAGVPYNQYWSQFVKQLWANYTTQFGKNDTVGFSIPVGADIQSRIRHMSYYYNGNYPYLYALDIYGDSVVTEYDLFLNANQWMNSYGRAGGWIIAESYYNDIIAANNFSLASTATGRTVFYLTQWPLGRGSTCSDVSVSPPTAYSNYHAYGF